MKLFQRLINLLKQFKSTRTKYHLNGKEINLTGDNTTIKSTNFSVDKNGNMTCNKATMKNIDITSGRIILDGDDNSQIIKIANSDGDTLLLEHRFITFKSADGNGISMYSDLNGEAYLGLTSTNGSTEIQGTVINTPEVNVRGKTLLSCSDYDNYIGTGSTYSHRTTNLRGNTVRIYAHSSGAVYLGYSGSTAVTSDENLKDIYEIDDKYIDFFNNLKPITYVYKDRGHRNHMGFGARQVEEALTKAGLTTEQFAGVLKDTDVTISADEAGREEDVHYDELYSLRYEEFIALNTMMIQRQAEQIEQLQNEIKELKGEK